MELTKQEIIEMLEENGGLGTARQASTVLPDVVDRDKDRDLLEQHAIGLDYPLSKR